MSVGRFVSAIAHVVSGAWALARLALTRRGGVVVFTHYQDIDEAGQDRQMGPLVDLLAARGTRFAEITLVPLGGGALRRNRAVKGRPFVSWAAILGPARILCLGSADRGRLLPARTAVASLALRMLRPRAVFVIDESGSGQPLVRAARRLGIRSAGVQHGGFLGGNPQYVPAPGRPFDVEPVDVLCLWSRWFQGQLLAASPIYSASNTVVTGRLRRAVPAAPRGPAERPRILVVEDGDAAFPQLARPYLSVLDARCECTVRIRHHPSRTRGEGTELGSHRGLAVDLGESDVLVGRRSTALLEGLHAGLPAILIGPPDPIINVYAETGFALPCEDPALLPMVLQETFSPGHRGRVAKARALVWGETSGDPAEAVLSAGLSQNFHGGTGSLR